MCNKAVDTHPSTIQFVPECYKNQEMREKAVNRCLFVFDSIANQYEPQEICEVVVYLYPFLSVYCPNKYKTQTMYDKAVGNCLAASKFISDWFVASKMLEKFDNASGANDGILFN